MSRRPRRKGVCAKLLQSSLTLCDQGDCSLPGSSVHGFLQARILEWVALPSSRGSSQPRDRTQGFRIANGFFTLSATREILFTSCMQIESYLLFLSHQPHLSNGEVFQNTEKTLILVLSFIITAFIQQYPCDQKHLIRKTELFPSLSILNFHRQTCN